MKLTEVEISTESLARLDAYSASFSPCQILQSSKWINFRQSLFERARLFKWQHDGNEGWFSAFEVKLPLNKSYYYIPRGPLIGFSEVWPKFLKTLKEFFKSEPSMVMFLRFEPDISFMNGRSAKHVTDIQPHRSLQTNLTLAPEQILENMHPKTRYNIRLALKKDLVFSKDDSDIDGFWKLMQETAKRERFKTHDKTYYEKSLSSGAARLATVRKDGKLLAAGMFFLFGNKITYGHGASSSNYRELMAPYVLHWQMMLFGNKSGFHWYDWHGIDDQKWPGFTRFKRGFGGEEIKYPGTFDLPLDSLQYRGYTVMRNLRRLF